MYAPIQHRLALSFIVVIVSSVLGLSHAADKSVQPSVGQWSGTGFQLDGIDKGRGSFDTWSVTLTVGPDSISVAYPSLSCGGVWKQERETAVATYYRETITYGFDNCIDQGLVVTSPMDGKRLRVEYYSPDTDFIAFAHLTSNN